MSNCTITNNHASQDGGGIDHDASGGHLEMNNSLIAWNQASRNGGGIRINARILGGLTIMNSTISNNTAQDGGGGIHIDQAGLIVLQSTTITGNQADMSENGSGDGGGINLDIDTEEATINIENSIVQGNTDRTATQDTTNDFSTAGGTFHSLGGNVLTDDFPSMLMTTDTTGDALLAPLAINGNGSYTHRLLLGSSAIDLTNVTSSTLTSDQRGSGYDRIVGATMDAGAYEYGTCIPNFSVADNNKLVGEVRPLAYFTTDGIIQSNHIMNLDTSQTQLTEIVYSSGQNIELQPGFEVSTGVEFRAVMDGCDDAP